MNRHVLEASSAADGAVSVEPATEQETREYLLERSKRNAAPILKSFVQNPDRAQSHRAGPLSQFVKNGDLRGLRAFLFLHTIISSGEGQNGWSSTLPIGVWARAFDTTTTAEPRSASNAATKILTRLVDRQLIQRTRAGQNRKVTVTLLRPDGSGAPYTRPDGSETNRFLRLSNAYWTDGWYSRLDLSATAMLLVALHERPGFELATEKIPYWYGWSADTAERGFKTLREQGLITAERRIKKAPLAPSGITEVNSYTLSAPFTLPRAEQ